MPVWGLVHGGQWCNWSMAESREPSVRPSDSTSVAPTPRRRWSTASEPVRIASEPFEVWRRPDALAGAIASVVGRLGVDGAPVALTTTAELVDAFGTQARGRAARARRRASGARRAPAARDDDRRRADRARGGAGRAAAVRGRQLDGDGAVDRALDARRDPGRLRRHDHGRDPDRCRRGRRAGTHRRRAAARPASSSTPARSGPTSRRSSRTCRSAAGPARCRPSCSRSAPTRICCGAA